MWKKLNTETVFKHPRLHVTEDTVILPNGKTTKYLLYSEGSDFVTVVPRTKDGRFLLVQDYSYPLNGFLLQFVEGVCDGNESALQAAERELQEEAGYTAANFEVLAYLPKHHRRDKARQIIVIADGLTKLKNNNAELEEQGISCIEITPHKLLMMIADGQIVQRNTLSAYAVLIAKKRAGLND